MCELGEPLALMAGGFSQPVLDLDRTIVSTKNGLQPQVQMTLAEVMAIPNYLSSTWVFYTRK